MSKSKAVPEPTPVTNETAAICLECEERSDQDPDNLFVQFTFGCICSNCLDHARDILGFVKISRQIEAEKALEDASQNIKIEEPNEPA